MIDIRVANGCVTFSVVVTPRSKREGLHGSRRGALRVAVHAPPTDGDANEALIELLATALSVPKASVEIIRGESARTKTIAVRGVTSAAVIALGKVT